MDHVKQLVAEWEPKDESVIGRYNKKRRLFSHLPLILRTAKATEKRCDGMNPKAYFGYLMCVLLLLPACEPETGQILTGESEAPSVLRRGNGDDPATLDPALAEDVHAFNVLIDIYEGLVAVAADGSIVPGVAESWDISGNGLVYRFKLRSDARWSNDDPVQARDFVNAFRRVAAPDSQSAYEFLLEPVENFVDVRSGAKPAQALGITAIDDLTLEIRLSTPSNHMLSVLAMPIAFPVHGTNPTATQFSEPDEFVGNGPYELESRQVGGPIRLRRNNRYWDNRSVTIDEIQYLPVIDPITELNMYRADELDITGTVPAESFKDLRENLPGELRVAPTLALYYLAFDLTEAPLNNRILRQALSTAIDREQLVDLVGRGETPAYSIVPPGVGDHVGAAYEWRALSAAEREQRARTLYSEAGYDSDNPLSIKLTYDTGSVHEFVALTVSSMWKEVLGVDVELEKKEWQLFLATRDDRPSWQIMRFSWFGDYNDAMTFTEIFRSGSSQNLSRYESAEFDDLLDRARSEIDANARQEIMTTAESVLLEDYPIIPLYFYVSKHLVKPHIAGFEDSILDRHPSRYLSLRGN